MSSVTIELGRDDRNMDVWVTPMNESRAGRWSRKNLSPGWQAGRGVQKLKDIPGWRITIDYRQNRVRIFHPYYKTDEGERAAREFQAATGKVLTVEPPTTFDELDDADVKRWLAFAWRLTHDKPEHCLATVVAGEFPKSTEGDVKKERSFDVHLRNAREEAARDVAMARAEAESQAEAKASGGK